MSETVSAEDLEDLNDHPKAVDPDDPPAGLDELYVGKTSTQRRYHTDPDCMRLKNGAYPRRVEIAAAWYVPCRFCVTEEFQRNGDAAEEEADDDE